jgi:hypothetical protein
VIADKPRRVTTTATATGYTSRAVTRLALFALVGAGACADPLTNDKTDAFTWEARNIKGYAQTATGEPHDIAFGWGLAIEGDTANWYACSAADTCGKSEKSRPKQDVLAVERAGTAIVGDGGVIDVFRLTLASGRKYIVPYTNPVKPAPR